MKHDTWSGWALELKRNLQEAIILWTREETVHFLQEERGRHPQGGEGLHPQEEDLYHPEGEGPPLPGGEDLHPREEEGLYRPGGEGLHHQEAEDRHLPGGNDPLLQEGKTICLLRHVDPQGGPHRLTHHEEGEACPVAAAAAPQALRGEFLFHVVTTGASVTILSTGDEGEIHNSQNSLNSQNSFKRKWKNFAEAEVDIQVPVPRVTPLLSPQGRSNERYCSNMIVIVIFEVQQSVNLKILLKDGCH